MVSFAPKEHYAPHMDVQDKDVAYMEEVRMTSSG